MKRGPELIRRLPKLRWRAPQDKDQEIVPSADRRVYGSMTEDFAFLDDALMPDFRRLDREALHCQNTFYLARLTLIMGSALATVLGAAQAGLGGGNLWLGLLETVIAAVIGLGALTTGAPRAQQGYFANRLRAERLRSEYFLYLARVVPYADEHRQQTLRRIVAGVASEGDGT